MNSVVVETPYHVYTFVDEISSIYMLSPPIVNEIIESLILGAIKEGDTNVVFNTLLNITNISEIEITDMGDAMSNAIVAMLPVVERYGLYKNNTTFVCKAYTDSWFVLDIKPFRELAYSTKRKEY